jgi:Reverse transcriptase (RNA-dependent DNA polymerase)
VLKAGKWQSSEAGTPQGGVKLVRYADDTLLCFSHKKDARRVYAVLSKRFEKYGLTLHPEKTRFVDFRQPTRREGESEKLSFLGFTLYWGQSREGRRVLKVKNERKRMTRKRMTRKLKEIGSGVGKVGINPSPASRPSC